MAIWKLDAKPVRLRWSLLLVGALGCSGSDSGDDRPDPMTMPLVPVTGTVKLNGEPLSGAMVTFLPDTGIPGNGETDEAGKYSLVTYGRDGLPAGAYKVAVSYLVSADGQVQGDAERSSLVQGPGMMTAKERLPAKYSDLGRTELTATVGEGGGEFHFDIDAPDVGVAVPDAEPMPVAEPAGAETPEEPKAEAPPAETPEAGATPEGEAKAPAAEGPATEEAKPQA